jgi:hypothetical protein
MWADWAILAQNQVRFILFLFYFYFPFLFQIQMTPCLTSKFQIYAQGKKTPHDAQFPPSIYLVILFIFILFKLGFQHDVHAPHYFNILLFECVVELKVNSEILPLF